MNEIADRKEYTQAQIARLQAELTEASTLVSAKACVYATGSYGRGEAGTASDLDLFIVSKTVLTDDKIKKEERLLSNLDTICVKADLIITTKKLGIREFDGDGKYLEHYTLSTLIRNIGDPKDDMNNTFTARLLLLLESTPILGGDVYDELIDGVIDEYWTDYKKHSELFNPAYLVNDILRLWRTFCVNYEARTQKYPELKRIERKKKNYTLKYSRLLTCYSALLYLLHVFNNNNTVRPEDAKAMASLTPLARLAWLRTEDISQAVNARLDCLIEKYNFFLETKRDEAKLLNEFSNSEIAHKHMHQASQFGEEMFGAITDIGKRSALHQIIVV